MVVKTGVALPDKLYEELARVARSLGYTSLSQAVRDAVQLFITLNRWASSPLPLAGVLQAVADRGSVERVAARLAAHHEVVTGYMVIPLDRDKAMLLVIVRGEPDEIKKLFRDLSRLRGVDAVTASLLPLPETGRQHRGYTATRPPAGQGPG
ncbi:MAG: CopG family ribbon-helix-helix protein [Crenarchaeota archaeon]|nr:CopG family ribbon-helix-helix protein [Thermoproteota archaeon]